MRKTGELQTVEWIPSRDIKQYLREIGYKFTDFEKAAIVYNSCRGWETIQRQLKQIKKETQDRTLAIQIEERLCYDEIILSQIKESTSKEIFLLEVYDEEVENYYKFLFFSFERAKAYGDIVGKEFNIDKLRVNGEEDIPIKENDMEECLGYITYDQYGDIVSFGGYESIPLEFPDMNDSKRFEHAYITVPYPFKKGDIVRETITGDIGIVYYPKNWQEGDTYLKKNIEYESFESVQLKVEFLGSDGKFEHRHICPIFLEFADIQNLKFDHIPKDELYKRVTKAASDMIKGEWIYPIEEFQQLFLEYLNSQKEKLNL